MPAPWVGYYTARPDFKRLVRVSSSLWRASQQLHALSRDASRWLDDFHGLLNLWQASSLAQHHDAVTGDEFGRVAVDYTRKLRRGMRTAGSVAADAVVRLHMPATTVDATTIDATTVDEASAQANHADGGTHASTKAAGASSKLNLCLNTTFEPCADVTAALGASGAGDVTVVVYNPQAWTR
jgi:hypothetical protein